jgi:hypothetical protein
MKLLGITNVDFDIIGQRLIRHSIPVRYWREVLYNILTEFGITRKLFGLIKICLNETYSRVRIGKNLSDMFTVQNVLKQGDALSPFFNFALEYAIRRVQEKQKGLRLKGTTASGLC